MSPHPIPTDPIDDDRQIGSRLDHDAPDFLAAITLGLFIALIFVIAAGLS